MGQKSSSRKHCILSLGNNFSSIPGEKPSTKIPFYPIKPYLTHKTIIYLSQHNLTAVIKETKNCYSVIQEPIVVHYSIIDTFSPYHCFSHFACTT